MTSSSEPAAPLNVGGCARPIRAAHEHAVVGTFNDHKAVVAVNSVPFPWHRHPNSDELFLVVEGALRLELADGRTMDLRPWGTWLVAAGQVHRTTPLGRCVNLVFERVDTETEFVT